MDGPVAGRSGVAVRRVDSVAARSVKAPAGCFFGLLAVAWSCFRVGYVTQSTGCRSRGWVPRTIGSGLGGIGCNHSIASCVSLLNVPQYGRRRRAVARKSYCETVKLMADSL